MIKASAIRELSADEITARIAELERERFNLKFRGATQTLDDPLRLRVIRRDIARLKTIAREQVQRGTATAAGKGRV
jgi:large subunit ribosomal protein L29